MLDHRTRVLAALGLVLLTAACGKKAPPEIVPAPVAETAGEDADAAARAAAERAAREAEAARRREAAARRATLEEMIFFDYDRSALRDDARSLLDAKLPILREDATIRLTIEGHADERGSTEYNLALGHRRAMSVKEFLVGYGLDEARFQPVSYGEERPLAQGQGESAWGRNRRAEFRVQGGRTITEGPEAGGSR
jgi:peptidoglycan-associated lipoprotein